MLPRLLFVCLLLPAAVSGQLTLEFEGLARTQVQYLVNNSEAIGPGTTPDAAVLLPAQRRPLSEQLDELRQTLVNLPAFTRADWRLDTSGGDTTVQWTLREGRTLFPVVNFGGVEGNTYYTLGFSDVHFRGRGQRLAALYQNNDGEHNYHLALENEQWRGCWGYRFETRRYAAVEPVYFPEAAVNYRYANLSFGGDLLYRLDGHRRLQIGLSTFNERYVKAQSGERSPGPERVNQQKLLLKAGRTEDRLNYLGERLSGTHHQTSAQAVRTFGEQQTFLVAWHDFRYFRPLGRGGNLAGRLRAGLSSNDETPFAPFVLDSQVNIRGSGNRIDRGTAQLILNLEYRHTVVKDRKERYATQLVAFSDLGTWRNPGGELSELWRRGNLRHFIGAGVRLISLRAHNAVLRLDYGVDRRNPEQRGFVAGFGQYF